VAIARTRRGNIVASSGIIGGIMGEWQVGRTRIDQFIRPDLNMYPGFSGSALIGTAGGILGLNTTGLVRGKCITIPSSTLTRIADEILAKGHVVQPYIGLLMYPVQIPDSLQKKANVDSSAGLLVMHVESGGPAELGGALLGDIVLDIDGNPLDDLQQLQKQLGRKRIGTATQANVIRGGERIQLTIQIGERPVG
jgi:S1-C subfamily serine protease